MKKISFFFFAVSLILFDISALAQCAMCKAGPASNLEGGGNTGRGLNTGILYLMTIPYILIAALFAYIFRKQISEKLKRFKSQYFSA